MAAFANYIVSHDPHGAVFKVGTTESGSCDIGYDAGDDEDPVQSGFTVFRPLEALWLWDVLYRLMLEYDIFMFWPDEELTAAVARPEVPLPADMPARKAVVGSPEDLRALIAGG